MHNFRAQRQLWKQVYITGHCNTFFSTIFVKHTKSVKSQTLYSILWPTLRNPFSMVCTISLP